MQVGILSQIKNAEQITRQVLRFSQPRAKLELCVLSRHLSLQRTHGVFQFRTAMAATGEFA
jgi:hypothetical protein